MNLYKVECHSVSKRRLWVYVAAQDAIEAQEKALKKMVDLKWHYDSWAGTVEVIATDNAYRGPELFIA